VYACEHDAIHGNITFCCARRVWVFLRTAVHQKKAEEAFAHLSKLDPDVIRPNCTGDDGELDYDGVFSDLEISMAAAKKQEAARSAGTKQFVCVWNT